jgi:hypothetical protein
MAAACTRPGVVVGSVSSVRRLRHRAQRMVDTNVTQTLPRIVCREESKGLRAQFISRRQHWISLGRYRKVRILP